MQYNTVNKDFESREKAFEWIILNQFGRRNIDNYQRAILALKLEPIIAKEAKQKQSKAGKLRAKSPEAEINTNKELSKIAGLGSNTIKRVKTIEQKASEETKEKLRIQGK